MKQYNPRRTNDGKRRGKKESDKTNKAPSIIMPLRKDDKINILSEQKILNNLNY